VRAAHADLLLKANARNFWPMNGRGSRKFSGLVYAKRLDAAGEARFQGKGEITFGDDTSTRLARLLAQGALDGVDLRVEEGAFWE